MWQVEKISSMNCLKYCAVVFASLFLSLACGNDGGTAVSEPEDPEQPETPGQSEESEGLVVEIPNPGFEQEVDFTGTAGVWKKTDAWQTDRAVFTYEPQGGFNGSAGIRIACTESDYTTDAVVTQSVSGLIPGKLYELSAMVRTSGVAGGRGGNVCLFGQGVWTGSEPFTGTNGWTRRSVQFIAEESTAVIGCRLGFWAGDSRGTVWFDDVALRTPEGMYYRESEHLEMYLEKTLVRVSDGVMDGWLAKLDKVYDAYTELFDFFVPFGGRKMIVLSKVIDAWAYAGYPIQWNRDYVASTLDEVARYDNAVFGIMHEMGHNFAPGNYVTGAYDHGNGEWNWNEELFANFRMYYALCRTGYSVYLNNTVYTGAQISDMYRKSYEETLARGIAADGDGLMYVMTRMADTEGWEPFRKTFRELYDLAPQTSCGTTKWEKIDYFFSVLSRHAGKDLMQEYFTQSEINALKTLR